MAYSLGQGQPIIVLKEGTERTKNREAQSNNIQAARAIADAVRTTLGPKGMDKMLVDSLGDVVITNDGVTILKEIDVQHPAAKMVVEVAKTQDSECGDGTTTSVVLSGELLKKAEQLIDQNVHPTIIANGYKLAAAEAVRILETIAVDCKDEDMLKRVAMTAMTGKSVGGQADTLADLAVKAVKSVAETQDGKTVVDVENIKVEKKTGGSIADTELINGLIIDKEKVHPRMPKSVSKAKVAILSSALEIKKTEVEAKIQIRDPASMQRFLDEEENTLKGMVEKIKAAGANVVFCQKGMDDLVQHYMSKAGIYACRRLKESDMEKLAKATGGNIVGNLDSLTPADLGCADLVEERKVGEEWMTFVTGCKNPKAMSIMIRGGTEHVIDEVERALHDALRVVGVALEDGKVVAGGGAPEIEMAMKLGDYASAVGGREQLAIRAFAEALEVIPWALAENAGLDPIDVVIQLKNAHGGQKASAYMGLDLATGQPIDMLKENVIEPMRVKTQAIESATEVAGMILRIDDVIASRKAPPAPPGAGGPGGMPGGMPGMM